MTNGDASSVLIRVAVPLCSQLDILFAVVVIVMMVMMMEVMTMIVVVMVMVIIIANHRLFALCFVLANLRYERKVR